MGSGTGGTAGGTAGVAGGSMLAVDPTLTSSLGLTAVATALPLIGPYGAYRQAQMQRALAEQNQRVAEWMEARAYSRGETKAARLRMEGTATISKARVAAGGSGLATESGSFVSVNETTRAMSELDAQTALSDALMEGLGYRAQAESYAAQADIAEMEMYTGPVSEFLGTGQAAAGFLIG